jgi:RNA polymerase sigma-70 factor (ECF subfamily)
MPHDPTDVATAIPLARIPPDDAAVLRRLRDGDESAFAELVSSWSAMMLRVARSYVSTAASAEEVVQDTWLAVIRGLGHFEERSSLRTWVLSILANLAKSRGVREARTVPWSQLAAGDDAGPTVDPDRFRPSDDAYPHNWTPAGAPTAWPPTPEESALAGEVRVRLSAAIGQLPQRQRDVVSLRDVHGLSAAEVCDVLGITTANQRVLLHRARAGLRAALEAYYRGAAEVGS